MTPDEFIAWLAPAAQAACSQYGLPAPVLIAQGALESGWGKYVIGEYNLFGRKWGGWGRYLEYPTTEQDENGNEYEIVAKFQDYDSLEQACEDWCILITQEPVYAPCLDYLDDINTFIEVLGGIYATDTEYANKIKRTINAGELMNYA